MSEDAKKKGTTKDAFKQLPFVTQPLSDTVLIGTESTGQIEFPRYNDLTIMEAAWLAANGGHKTAFSHTSKVALKIAKEEKVKPLDAHAFVSKILATAMGTRNYELSEKEQLWSVKYVREIEECAMGVLESSVHSQNNLVTCVIRHRLPGMSEWQPQDTSRLPSELVEEIYKFALTEQNRGVKVSLEEAEEDLAEELGKSNEVSSKTNSPTGEKSTTNLEISTRETRTTRRKGSANSEQDSPSKPLSEESS